MSVTVHHLFGNTSVRFNQWDDTLTLAVKLDGVGGWHLAGGAGYTPDSILPEQVKLACSLDQVLKGRAKIIIPPIPLLRHSLSRAKHMHRRASKARS